MTEDAGKRPMRIVVAAGEFPKRSETFVLDQVLYLVRAGHAVSVLCEKRGDESILSPEDRETLTRVPVHALPDFSEGLPSRLPWRVREAIRKWLTARQFHSTRADVVLAHFGWVGARIAALLHPERAGQNPALITVYHGNDVAVSWRKNRMADFADLFSKGTLHLPVNGAFASLLVRAGAPADRVRTHHLGVPVGEYAFREPRLNGTLRLLSVCRLVEKKGLNTAIHALALLRARHPELDWHYDIGGEGPEESGLRALVEEAGLSDRIHFLGPLKHDETLARIAKADVLLQPSVTAADGDQEGIPVILMEAMAIGAIVCSSRHSGIPELVEDGISGLLAEEGDAEGLAQNLARFATGAVNRPAMAHAARTKVETEFSDEFQNALLLAHLRVASAGGTPS